MNVHKHCLLTPNASGLKFWSDDAFRPHPTHSFAWYAGIYALLQVCALASLLLLAVAVLVLFVKKAGATLHWDLLRTLVRAPLSFFVATDTGVVTNLFSQDLNLVDTELPNAFLNTLSCVSSFYQSCCHTTYQAHRIYRFPLPDLRPDLLTMRNTGGTGHRPSSSDAYFISLSGNQLSLPCSVALCFAEVLFEDVTSVEAVGS